jgi:uncharacterized protein (DUF1501 family)
MPSSRRQFLLGSAAALAAAGLPLGLAHAQAMPGDTKFIFVFADGGWDPTRVFAPEFDNANVDMEPGAQRAMAGRIPFVDSALRPSVSTFLQRHYAKTTVFNGVLVRSIAHEICKMIALTGSSSGTQPDWPAILASARQDRYTLPHLVLGGPSFPGDLGAAVARTGRNGQLESLLSGQATRNSDIAVPGFSRPAEGVLDRYLARRSSARRDASSSPLDHRLLDDFTVSHTKATTLKDLQYVMDFDGGNQLAGQANVAVQALSLGLSRCITLQHNGQGGQGWDTHANNDVQQSTNFEDLFAGLNALMRLLETTPGEVEPTLADETVVIVLSEMGRTLKLNAFIGKDHWPYTSVMMTGPGITGDRVIGGFDDVYYGNLVDPATGDTTDSGQILSAEAVGATLLALADIDPSPFVSGVSPIRGVLA